jgi:Putative MetA-pathway of phenol degradation
MPYIRIWLFCAAFLAAGWLNPAIAADAPQPASSNPAPVPGAIQFEGPKAGCPPEPAKDECPSTFGPIITDTAIPIEKGKFALQPTFGLGFTTSNFSPNWRRISAEGNFTSLGLNLKFTYGLWNNLEVYAVIPYFHNWASSVQEPGPRGERAASFGGLGDINLTFKYRLVEETETVPTVSAIFSPTFPSGHFRHLNPGRLGTDAIGGGTYAFTSGFNVSKYLKPFIVYGNLWYTMQTDGTILGVDPDDNPVYNRNHPRDYVTVNLAAEYPLTKKWIALLELTSYWDGGRLIGPKANQAPTALLSTVPGIEYMATEKFSLALGLQIDLVGKNTAANLTPLLSMVYAF